MDLNILEKFVNYEPNRVELGKKLAVFFDENLLFLKNENYIYSRLVENINEKEEIKKKRI